MADVKVIELELRETVRVLVPVEVLALLESVCEERVNALNVVPIE